MTRLFVEVGYLLAEGKDVLLVAGAVRVDGSIVPLPEPQLCIVDGVGCDEDLLGKFFLNNKEGIFPTANCRKPTMTESSSINRHCLVVPYR